MKLYNVMDRKTETFKPRDKKLVKMFTCGSSIYRRPHIGNYRTFLYEDLLLKYLHYQHFNVKRVMVFTDVEDKGIEEAHNKKRELKRLTDAAAAHFYKDVKLLNIEIPKHLYTSADSVKESVRMIQKLLKNKIAYWYQGDVYFDPKKKKDFGKLFHLDMKKWPLKHIHFSRDNYDGNHWYLGDFVLWHGYKPGDDIFWRTTIGKGRPAWHIQDPAIIVKTLGYQVDINCGGIDNIYRHHDYTIAILESLSHKPYANYYLLGEHLLVDGKKMSKSLGNIIYPSDLRKKKYTAKQIRFYLAFTKHYRKKLNFTLRRFTQRAALLTELQKMIKTLLLKANATTKQNKHVTTLINKLQSSFEFHLNNDLDAPMAIKALQATLSNLVKHKLTVKQKQQLQLVLKRIDTVFGVLF